MPKTDLEIAKMAIMLLYPDKELETIPIGKYTRHIDYLIEHLTKSKKFAYFCKGKNIKKLLPQEVYLFLVEQGITVFHNFNVQEIVYDPSLLLNDLPGYWVFLPTTFWGLEDFLSIYPNEKISFHQYSEKRKWFQNISLEEVKMDVEPHTL